jgi:phosphate transport system substrate-binding protein
MALIKNKSGNYIKPTLDTISLSGNVDIPNDTRVTITDTDAAEGYPIVSFTWLIFYKEQNYNNRTKKQAEELTNLLKWVIKDGQEYCIPLDYSPLSPNAVEKSNRIIERVTFTQ